MTPAQRKRLEAMRDGGNLGLPVRDDLTTRALIRSGCAFRRQAKLWLTSAGRRELEQLGGRAVCAWCERDLGPRPDMKPGTTTHGICTTCRRKVLTDARPLACGRRVCDTHPGGELDMGPVLGTPVGFRVPDLCAECRRQVMAENGSS